ncbi:unnamed protein product [Candida verbasci]|uniref:Spindle pole body component n=1 Tax=Candida verbasci TaxID=1227364 RepID=A0A9W4X8D3_9ASCO|nr:unnamed protein product [Candida verbasci]
MNKIQLIKLYISRLIHSLVPQEFGDEYIASLSSEISEKLLNSSSQKFDLSIVVNKIKVQFLNNGFDQEWIEFQNIITELTNFKSIDQICNYLIFLNSLNNPNEDYQYQPTFKVPENATLSQIIQPYYKTLSEETIVLYLPYVLLGSESKLFKFKNNSIIIPNDINNSFSLLLKEIFEIALLYKQLELCIQENKGKFKSSIKSAFISMLEIQINNYVKEINLLFSTSPTNLIQIYSGLYSWLFKLRFLYRCSKKLNLEGFAFISFMHRFTNFDNQISDFAKLIFSEIVKPYYNIMEHWLIKGELTDEGEFFISFDSSQNEFNKIIKFDQNKVLPKFSKEVANKIYQIGKTLIFLNKYCRELRWVNEFNLKYSNIIFNDNKGLISMSDNAIINLVSQQYEEIVSYLTLVIHSKNNSFEHFKNLKKIYFMQYSEFIESIMCKGYDVFNQQASQISPTYLNKILQESISKSSIKNFDDKNRIDSRIINSGANGFGWELFTVEYRIDDLPMSYILFEGQQHLKYLKIFHFLWNLRHLQFLLNQDFILYKQLKNIKQAKVINIIRFKFAKFINELINYLSFEIIEESFETFIIEKLFYNNDLVLNKSFMNLPDTISGFNVNQFTIDQLINLHENYLDNIINTKIFNENIKGKKSNQSFINQIYKLFQIIFTFLNTSKEFHSLGLNYNSLIINNQSSEFEQDLQNIQDEMNKLLTKLDQDIYKLQYGPQLYVLKEDLKLDLELKNLNRMI